MGRWIGKEMKSERKILEQVHGREDKGTEKEKQPNDSDPATLRLAPTTYAPTNMALIDLPWFWSVSVSDRTQRSRTRTKVRRGTGRAESGLIQLKGKE